MLAVQHAKRPQSVSSAGHQGSACVKPDLWVGGDEGVVLEALVLGGVGYDEDLRAFQDGVRAERRSCSCGSKSTLDMNHWRPSSISLISKMGISQMSEAKVLRSS